MAQQLYNVERVTDRKVFFKVDFKALNCTSEFPDFLWGANPNEIRNIREIKSFNLVPKRALDGQQWPS